MNGAKQDQGSGRGVDNRGLAWQGDRGRAGKGRVDDRGKGRAGQASIEVDVSGQETQGGRIETGNREWMYQGRGGENGDKDQMHGDRWLDRCGPSGPLTGERTG